MDGKKAVTTDLGLIRVESFGKRDVVFLKHNNVRIFTVSCASGRESRVTQNPEFVHYAEAQRVEIFAVYDRWKRKSLPQFHMPPTMHGRTLDGRQHPWRQARPAAKGKRPTEQP